jgi:uncharacterized ferredoxin-like protein
LFQYPPFGCKQTIVTLLYKYCGIIITKRNKIKVQIYLHAIVNLPLMSNAVRAVAELMEISARTAPKAAGQDYIEIVTLYGDDLKKVGEDMLKIAEERKIYGFARDGKNVLASEALVLIGVKEHGGLGLDCAACGVKTCGGMVQGSVETDFAGPSCSMRLLDMGIALGSAVKTASMHNVDNRIMYRAGVSARRLGFIKASVVMGIPLSATGKSIYYDR